MEAAVSEVRVVNVRSGEPYDVYTGRQNPRYRLGRSKWANPFKIGPDGSREEVMAKYRAWIQEQPELLAALPELAGKRLACWCRPPEGFNGRVLCHGQILAGLANGVPPESID